MRLPRWGALLSFVLGISCVLAAWGFGNPPGAGPDEPSHYVRAVGAASGTVIGEPGGYGDFPRYTPIEHKFNYNGKNPYAKDLTPFAGVNAYTRSYTVPAGLEPVTFGCNAFAIFTSAKCVNGGRPASVTESFLSQHAGQNPLPYLLAGPLMVQMHTPQDADRAGRCVLAFFCLLLIGLPLVALDKLRSRLLLCLAASLTPMVFFTGAILNPSGIEIFSSVGFFISLLALAEGRHPRAALGVCAFTGVFVTMSRPFGPFWIFVSLVAVFGLAGKGALWAGIRRLPRASFATAVAIGLGAASTFAVLSLYTEPAKVAVHQLPARIWRNLAEQAVGNFGWVDSPMPSVVVDGWLLFMIGLTVLALVVGSWRDRFTVLATTVLVYAMTYVLELKVLLPEQIGEQGRHSLPVFVLLPMTTILVLSRQRAKIRAFTVGIPVVVMLLLQGVGWLANGARQGLGIPDFKLRAFPSLSKQILFDHPAWSPPGGFGAWLIVLFMGCALILLAALQSLRDDPSAVVDRVGTAGAPARPEPSPSIALEEATPVQ